MTAEEIVAALQRAWNAGDGAEMAACFAEGVLVLNTASTLRAPTGPRAGVTEAVQTMAVSGGDIVAFQNTIKADLAAFAERDEDLARRKPAGWADEEPR